MMSWKYIWITLCQTFLMFWLLVTSEYSSNAVGVLGAMAPPVRVTRLENTPDRFSVNNSSVCDSGNGCRFRPSSSLPANVVQMNDCDCECPAKTSIYQDNTATCVQQIPDVAGCPYGSLSDGMSQAINPTVHLPAYGHIIRRQINLTFPGEVERDDAACYIVECQFLSAEGWAPFSTIHLGSHYPRFRLIETTLSQRQAKPKYIIYNLQWLGSSEHADYLQGRIVLLTAMCNSTKLPSVNLCFLMRIVGTSGLIKSAALMDTAPSSHFNDSIETGVLVAAACGGALGVLYIIVLAMFVASRLRKNKKRKRNDDRSLDYHDNMTCDETETGSAGLPVGLASNGTDISKISFSSSSWSDEMKYQNSLTKRGSLPLSLRYLYSPPPFFLNDVLIVQTPEALRKHDQLQVVLHDRHENKLLPKPPVRRRKIYFDPDYLDVECLKNPPYEAESFRAQIHCMVNITKSRLDKRKFLPHLEIIDEENKPGRGKTDTLDRSSNDQLQQINAELIRIQNSSVNPKGSRELDAVVLNHDPKSSLQTVTSLQAGRHEQGERDWSQILKDEWGSDESLQQTANREKPTLDTSDGTIKSSKVKTSVATVSDNSASKTRKTIDVNPARPTKRSHEDDDYDDKTSDRSGNDSVTAKDSGIEDEVNSNTSSEPYAARKHANTSVPVISRKKIISANATPNVTTVPSR